MLIRQNQYPKFDSPYQQLLTSDHLNMLFGYVEEQDRLTRANLIGIGILCGMEVSVNETGTEITISKGVGVTSLGYIVSTETRTYTEFKAYDPTQDRKYPLFVDGNNRSRFHIDELKAESAAAGTTMITRDYLKNRVVVMYVELLSENNKNCDPTSCDDKGIKMTVNLRPMLIHRDDVARYMGARVLTDMTNSSKQADALPVLQMRRFNVPATPLQDSATLLGAYQTILSRSFFSDLEVNLNKLYEVVKPLVADIYPANPFAGIATRYSFLYNNPSASDLVYIQYYYDLFSDIFTAYNALRDVAMGLVSVCMPDETLFPQHLLLGTTGITGSLEPIKQFANTLALVRRILPEVADTSNLTFRTDFMPSAAIRSCCGNIGELRSMFKRLVLLQSKFSIQRKNVTALQTYGNTGVVGPVRTNLDYSLTGISNVSLVKSVKSFNTDSLTLAGAQNLVKIAATPASINISTGITAAGTVQTAGATELNWVCPAGMNKVIAAHPAWDSLAGCAWLGNREGMNQGNYTYTRSFTISSSGTLSFQAMADNAITVLLDGKEITKTPNNTTYGFKQQNMVNYTGIVTAGTHTLTVQLYNDGGPVGLDLKGSVAYTIPAPPPPPKPVLPAVPPIPQIKIPVRVTPSFLGRVPLSDKSIPYYYDVTGGSDPLYLQWDYKKTKRNQADRNLSYNSDKYNNGTPDFVNKALRYDLEKYNFFLVEGHLGNDKGTAMNDIKAIRDQYRLPFEVITLRSTIAAAISGGNQDCCTEGVQLSYSVVSEEWKEAIDNFRNYLVDNKDAAALTGVQSFFDSLQPAYNMLKENVADFVGVYNAFKAKLQSIDSAGRALRTELKKGSGKLYEDTIDHLDEVILTYKLNAFDEIYKAYSLAQKNVKRDLSIAEYLKQNPGIQHKAGVPKGGTFILVYHTKTVPAPTIPKSVPAQQNNNNQAMRSFAAPVEASVSFTDTPLTKPVTAVKYDLSKAVDELVLLKDSGATPNKLEDKLREMLWIKDVKPVEVRQETINIFDSIAEGTVIADFYVPYNCCNEDCPTIKFMPGEDQPVQATIFTEKTAFCSADAGRYEVTVTPGGGAFSGIGLVYDDGSDIADGTVVPEGTPVYFMPSKISIGATDNYKDHVITYTKDGSVALLPVRVHKKPVLTLNAAVSGSDVTVSYTMAGTGAISWSFGDGSTYNNPNLTSHQYQNAGTYTITLTATNEICGETSVTKQVTIADVGLTVDTDIRTFCQGDSAGKATYHFTVTPVDATVTIDGVAQTVNSSGVCTFSPAAVSIAAGGMKNVVIKAVKGNLSKTITMAVYAVPAATFQVNKIGLNEFAFRFTGNPDNTVSWNFGDSSTSQLPNPGKTYAKAGTYTVTLTVDNKGCPSSSSQTVTVENVQIKLDTLVICQSDSMEPRPIYVTPAGGEISGEGVIKGSQPMFDPKLITFDKGQTWKDVNLTYSYSGISDSVKVRVYKAPDTTFSSTEIGNNVVTFSYAGTLGENASLEWSFGDNKGVIGKGSPYNYQFERAGTYEVTLMIRNEPCQPVRIVIPVTVKGDPARVEIAQTQFCKTGDSGAYEISVSPSGGVLSIDGVAQQAADRYYFRPADVTVPANSFSKNIKLHYAVNNTTDEKWVTVDEVKAAFDLVLLEDNKTVSITNHYYAYPGYFDMGDGHHLDTPAVSEFNLTYVYQKPGTYTVKLVLLYSGPCVLPAPEKTVTIAGPQILVSDPRREFCAGENTDIVLRIQPDSGGVFALNGQRINGTTYTFNPSKAGLVNGAANSQTFTFTYTLNGETATVSILVYPQPAINFTIEDAGPLTKRFTNKSVNGTVMNWVFKDGQVLTGETVERTFPEGMNYVSLTVTNGHCPVTFQQDFTVVKPDEAKISASDGRTQFCPKDAGVTLTASPAGGTFTKDGQVINGTTATFNPSQQGVTAGGTAKTVTYTYTLSNGSTTSVNFVVNPLPVVNFDFVPSGNFRIGFTNASSSGATVQSWDFGDNTPSGTGESVQHTYATEGTYTVTLTVSNGKCTDSISRSVTVVKPAQPVLSASDGRREFCTNDSGITLTASPAGGSFTKDGQVITGTTATFNPSQQGVAAGGLAKTVTYTYALNGSSTSIVLVVNPQPAVNFDYTASGNLGISFANNSPGTTVQSWNFGDSKTGVGESVQHTYATEGTYTVTLTVSNGKCTNSISRSVTVVKAAQPQFSISDNRRSFCSNDVTDVVVLAYPAGGVLARDGQVISSSTTDFIPAEEGVVAGGSSKTITYTYTLNGSTASVTFTIYAIPQAYFDAMFVDGFTYSFVSNSGGNVLSWDFGNGNGYEGMDALEYTFPAAGIYTVSLTISDGRCTNSYSTDVVVRDPESGNCTLPCDGKSETSVYTWPSDAEYLQKKFAEGGMYSFVINRYVIDKTDLVKDPVRIDITAEDFNAYGFSHIFDRVNAAVTGGVQMAYDPNVYLFDGKTLNFTIKRYVCQSFSIELQDDYLNGENMLYTYTEKNLMLNGKKVPQEQRLNPVLADDCITKRDTPCQGRAVMCDYQWPHGQEMLSEYIQGYDYPGYEIIVHEYSIDDNLVGSKEMHYVLPFNRFRNGLPDIMSLLNSSFQVQEALYFGVRQNESGNTIQITVYECQSFTLDVTVKLTDAGTPLPETEMRYVFNTDGTFDLGRDGNEYKQIAIREKCDPVSMPLHISGINAWWKADVGFVTKDQGIVTWQDQSGKGNDLVYADYMAKQGYSAPHIEQDVLGVPCITFERSALGETTGILNDEDSFTILYVGDRMLCRGLQVSDKEEWSLSLVSDSVTVKCNKDHMVTIPDASVRIMGMTFNQVDFYTMRSSLALYDVNGAVTPVTVIRDVSLCPSTFGFTLGLTPRGLIDRGFINGQVYEIMIYNRVLNEAEMKQAMTYLKAKYSHLVS